MELKVFRCLWGVIPECGGPQYRTLETMLAEIAKNGYEGVEVPIKTLVDFGIEKVKALLKEHKLRVIPICFTDGPNASTGLAVKEQSAAEHLRLLEAQIEQSLNFDPVLINVHGGRDFFSREERTSYFRGFLELQKAKFKDVIIAHETHRGRILYSPWIMDEVMKEFPELLLVSDYSHFVNVAEAFLECTELRSVFARLAKHVVHIHARVGHEEGPQVSDPRAPEFASYLAGFEELWSEIWAAQKEKGMKVTTLTPEHGAYPYQPSVPYTKQPLADLWEVNVFIANRQKERFSKMN